MEYKDKKINFKYNLKEYLSFVLKYKKICFFLVASIIIFESIYLADSFLFKKIVDNSSQYISGELSRAIFVKYLLLIGFIFISVILFRSFLRWHQHKC
jgi:hypothetical protein